MNKNKNFAILILSTDSYCDLWPCFLGQFKRNFYTTKYEIYLGSNTKTLECNEVKMALSGPDADWSTSLLYILEKIPQEYLFIILEDQISTSQIDLSRFDRIVETMINEKISFIKYWPIPLGTIPHHKHSFLMGYEKWMPYRISVCGFWRKEILENILIPGEDPWNFEILGSYRSSKYMKFYSLDTPLFTAVNMVEKGKWISESLKIAKKLNWPIDVSKRELMTRREIYVSKCKTLVFNFMKEIKWETRLKIMNFLRRLFVSY